MIEQGEKSDYPLSIFITKMVSPYGIVEISGDRLVSFKEKPVLDYYINGGVYFSKGEIDFGSFDVGDIEKTVFPMLAKDNKLGYYKENGLFWMAIDTSKELESIKKEYENREDKPWGYEKILINTEKYLTKELFIGKVTKHLSITIHRRMKQCTLLVVQVTLNLRKERNTLEKMTPYGSNQKKCIPLLPWKTQYYMKFQHHI